MLSLLPSPDSLLSTFPWRLLASFQILQGHIHDTGFYPAMKQQLQVDFIFQMTFSSHPSNRFVRSVITVRTLKVWDVGPLIHGWQDLWTERTQHNYSVITGKMVTIRQQLSNSQVRCTDKLNSCDDLRRVGEEGAPSTDAVFVISSSQMIGNRKRWGLFRTCKCPGTYTLSPF